VLFSVILWTAATEPFVKVEDGWSEPQKKYEKSSLTQEVSQEPADSKGFTGSNYLKYLYWVKLL